MKKIYLTLTAAALLCAGCIVTSCDYRSPVREEYGGTIHAVYFIPATQQVRIVSERGTYIVANQIAVPLNAPITVTVWTDGTRSIYWPGIRGRYNRWH